MMEKMGSVYCKIGRIIFQKFPSQWIALMRAMKPVNVLKIAGFILLFLLNLIA